MSEAMVTTTDALRPKRIVDLRDRYAVWGWHKSLGVVAGYTVTHLPSGHAFLAGLDEEQAESVFEWLKLNAPWVGRKWLFGCNPNLARLSGGKKLHRMRMDLIDDMAEAVDQ